MKNISFRKSRTLAQIPIQRLSVYSNQRHKIRYFLGDQEHKLDFDINFYESDIQAYLEKRWITKSEIEPKIYTIKPLKSLCEGLKTQKLLAFTVLFPEEKLTLFSKTLDMDSKYIMSIVLEPYFKPMMDRYLEKVLLNGQVPPMQEYEEYAKIKKRVLGLYRKFFFGDEISDFEKSIEKRYLAQKQKKWLRYLENRKLTMNKCVWTFNDQKTLEGFRNWRSRNLNLYDDFRPFYDDFPEYASIFFEKRGLWARIRGKSSDIMFYPASVLLSRTMAYCQSLEFINNLGIPPDYHIEISIINAHLALILWKLDLLKGLGRLEWDSYRISFESLEPSMSMQETPSELDRSLLRLLDTKDLKEVSFHWFFNFLFRKIRKFYTLSAYDYYNDREESEKKANKKKSKYFWKAPEKSLKN